MVLLRMSQSHSAPVQQILLCAHLSVCHPTSPLCHRSVVCSLIRPSVHPSPQVTLPYTWHPSMATHSASASCCRYWGWEHSAAREGGRVLCQRGVLSVLELPSLPTGAVCHGGSQLCLVLCRAAQHLLGPLPCQGATSTAAVCLSVPCPSVTQALSLRPPALWTWPTAEAKQRCTMQVSGDSANPVLLLSPPEAECSASVLLPSGQRLHLVLGDPL